MDIAIMGSGGVGGYYGGLLALGGHQVTFLARGAHLEAIRSGGLRVESVHGNFAIRPARAEEHPTRVGPVDLVVFCTKAYSIEAAAGALGPMLSGHTCVLPLLNGVEAAERIGAVIGMRHVLGGATWISSAITQPGCIRQVSHFRRVVLGELDGTLSKRARRVQAAFEAAGITTELTRDIRKVLWTKFVFLSTAAGIGSLSRLPIGRYRHIPETRALMESLMREAEAIGRGEGVDLDAQVVSTSMAFIDRAEPDIKASMQLDVEAGRRSELEALVGVISRKGKALGIPTPCADFVYAALLPGERAAQQGG